ncbi:MAG: VWA domain-containing protein [Candidatus Contendobacter sp.]|nr:VWA domain-containing protein [Candidatus Contendobacter sp.]
MKLKILIANILLASAGAVGMWAANAADLYKWTDDKGQVHYTSSPPPESAKKPQQIDPANPGNTTALPTQAAATSTTSAPGVLFILDASGSMKAKIGNQEKMAIAKDVMTNLLRDLPDTIQVGLEVYGHRAKGDCGDIELLAPVGRIDKAALIQQIQSIDPKGMTPITQALQIAAERLKTAEAETTVVLVSDGEETCKGDPCAAVGGLLQQGIRLKVHVVGFDVGDKEKQQLVCIAQAGQGKYFTANNAEQLKGALTEVKQEVVKKIEAQPVQPLVLDQKPLEAIDKSTEAPIQGIDNPFPIQLGMTSKIVLDQNERGYFKISLPADTFKVILDTYQFDGKDGNLQSSLSLLDQDGVSKKDNIIHFNEIDTGYRRIYRFSSEAPTEVGFKLANENRRAIFWLTVLKESDSNILPFFGKTIPMEMAEGAAKSGALDTNASAYYITPLKKGDYKVLVDFTNAAGKSTNLQGYLAILDADGGNQKELVKMNEIDVSYRKSGLFSNSGDQAIILRIVNKSSPIKYSIKVTPAAQ